MSNFNDIQNIWQAQPSGNLPDVEAIKKAADKNRRQIIVKNILGLVSLGLTLVIVGYIGLVADFKYVTTKLGIALVIISIVGAMVLNSQMLRLILGEEDTAANNQAYLQQLITYRNKQRFFQTTGMTIYFILLTTGLMLYLYEFYARSTSFGLMSYTLTLLWIAFAWFYIKPKTIQKQEKKITALIEQIQSLSEQLEK
jgi:hypothetical protein